MQKEKYTNHLISFLSEGTSVYTATKFMKEYLEKENFQNLQEQEPWHLKPGNYFVIRNDASLIAFQIGKKYTNSFSIITTHSDTPSLFVKPKNEIFENGYLKINVQPYGGILNYGWLDHPLSLSGKVILNKKNTYTSHIIDFKRPLLVIPSVAIHQNEKANTNLDLNAQVDLIPIIDLQDQKEVLKEWIHKEFSLEKDEICDYDLHLYATDTPCVIGKKKNILLSPRIDNLTSSFAALQAIKEAKNENNINVFCSFNSEEIGSLTKEGADSTFLLDTLKRIAAALQIDLPTSLANSFIISSDNTHAVHPNHPDAADPTNKIYLNQGIAISKEQQTTTTSLSSSLFKALCHHIHVPVQEFTSRNDMTSGSTLAGISIRHVSATSIDVGLAQLAMHSSVECVGLDDTYHLYLVFKEFYQTTRIHQKKSTKLIF